MLTTYTHDPVVNRTGVTRAGTTTSHSDDRVDRVPVAESFAYDANGNLTLAPPNSFGYDAANRLVSTGSSPAAGTYTYDGDGTRVARDVSGTPATNHFTYVFDRPGRAKHARGRRGRAHQ